MADPRIRFQKSSEAILPLAVWESETVRAPVGLALPGTLAILSLEESDRPVLSTKELF